jgi:tRNA 2-thiouridine synthesizing protein A
MGEKPDRSLDLRGVVCPMNWVQAKLQLEEMEVGQVLEVIVDDGDAVRNLPRSVKAEGHKIIAVTPLAGAFKLWVEKAA